MWNYYLNSSKNKLATDKTTKKGIFVLMFIRFQQHIQKNFPFLSESKLLIATSGGLDSVVLTHLLSKLGYSIGLAHVNFQLREDDSNKDEAFVKTLGKQLSIPVFTFLSDTNSYIKQHKMSVQMAAREIRYKWFKKLLIEKEYDYVLTAHHLDDSIETFFINLSRSAGLEGLTGIPDKNNKIIRPLLPFSRNEIYTYAQQNEISWREDISNATTHYLRNKIRHKLLPTLKEINPDFDKVFATTQSHLKESQALVQDYISQIKFNICEERNNLMYMSLQKLKTIPNQKAVLYELLKSYNFTEWNDIFMLIDAQTGKQVFSKSHYLLKDRGFLVLGVIEKEISTGQKVLEIDDEFEIRNLRFKITKIVRNKSLDFKSSDSNEVYFDLLKMKFPLFVRKWRKGDYFYPLGMKGKMKLSNFYINQKISILEKEKIWLLCDVHDQIIWVIGKRLDNRFRITDTTTEILKITTKNE